MTFDKNKFKDNYSTDKDNILKEFYIPILKESISYDRAVGYFSSQGLVKYLQGIDGLVKNNGKMRLIIGDTLSDDEYESINNSEAYSEIYSRLDKTWSDIFNSSVTELSKHRLAIFSWLLNRGFLEVRYAFRRKGLFHKKIGIVKDKKGNIVTFSGSMNETEAAMASNVNNPNGNSEEFVVFGSWDVDIFRRYGQEKVDSFNKVWEDCEDNTTTVKLPSAHYERIKDIYKNDSYPKSDSEKNQAELYDQITVNLDLDLDLDELDFSTPRLPKKIGGRKYQIQEHQVKALTDWKKSNYHGIMALATGAGKTITSIHGFVKFSETRPLALVVSVPYRVLAEQWCEVLSTFNIQAIKCYDGREKWESKLINGVGNFLLNIKKYLAVVVVNDTLRKEHFYSQINKIGNVVLADPDIHSWTWIKQSELIATITGTVGVEAVHMKKPVISFGKHQIINHLQTVLYVESYKQTKSAIDWFLKGIIREEDFESARLSLGASQLKSSIKLPEYESVYFSNNLEIEMAKKALKNLFSEYPVLLK